ncbi:gastrin/cholecystokinin type B receptor-like [Littorina saxatilis]|uniref:gastrin/cholecystokinin type B receptor-like n=1 Tax=Littorina saxatilis TaxID=31220 RepID=UPI0038B685B5
MALFSNTARMTSLPPATSSSPPPSFPSSRSVTPDAAIIANSPMSLPTAELYCDHMYNVSNASTIAHLVFPNATRDDFVAACLGDVKVSNKMSAFLSIPYAIIFLLSVVGNGLVILTLVRHKKMRTITNMYLLNLAVSDLLLAVFCMPFTLVPMMMQAFIFGNVICVMIRYLQAVSVGVSCFTLVAISIERFYAICQPLRSRRWQTLKHSYRVLLLIWITALLLMVPIAVFTQVLMVKDDIPACREIWPSFVLDALFAVLLDLLLFAMPLLLMGLSYALIAKELWSTAHLAVLNCPSPSESNEQFRCRANSRDPDNPSTPLTAYRREVNNQQGRGHHQDQDQHQANNQRGHHKGSKHTNSVTTTTSTKTSKGGSHGNGSCSANASMALRPSQYQRVLANKRRVVKMLFVVVLEYFVCWGPLYTLNTWAVLDYRSLQLHVTQTHRAIIFLIAYLSSCVHPITYCFMHKRFRQSFADAFRCCLRKGSGKWRLHSEGSQDMRLVLSTQATSVAKRANGQPR